MLDAAILLILATDSKSLYDCLVRLGTTIEKRLMIDVMALRQFYERREITEMKWVHEVNNPADFMTKNKSFSALRTLIDINQINLDTSEWVERATTKKTVNQMTRNVQTNEWDENFRKMIRKRWFSTFQRDSSVDTS